MQIIRDPARQLLGGVMDPVSAVRRAAFASVRLGEPIDAHTLARRTGQDEEAIREALRFLVNRGMADLDADGQMVAVAGLSLVPAPHRLTLNGVPLYTWCALDAVGIPAALRADATAVSRCPHCGQTIDVRIEGGRVITPHVAVIWFPGRSFSRVFDDLCPEINAFCNLDHLAEWRKENGDPPGRALSFAEVEELGEEWWGDMR